jgi:hypothetical protein
MNINELEKMLKRKKPRKIFPLDGTESLPMAGRLKRGIKSLCFFCKSDIVDETFVAGFKAGHKNVLMHQECFEEEHMLYTSTIVKKILPGF